MRYFSVLSCPAGQHNFAANPKMQRRGVLFQAIVFVGKGVRYIIPKHASLMELYVRREAPSELKVSGPVA